MRLYTVALIAILSPGMAHAQTGKIPESEVRNLANDLAGIQQLLYRAQQEQLGRTPGTPTPWVFPHSVKVTGKLAFARAGATESADRVAPLNAGQSYKVIDKVSHWYAVELPTDSRGVKTGWVSATNVVPERGGIELVQHPGPNYSQAIYDAIIREIADFKRKYDDNPYVSATGFSVTLQLPFPSVSVSFEFKK